MVQKDSLKSINRFRTMSTEKKRQGTHVDSVYSLKKQKAREFQTLSQEISIKGSTFSPHKIWKSDSNHYFREYINCATTLHNRMRHHYTPTGQPEQPLVLRRYIL